MFKKCFKVGLVIALLISQNNTIFADTHEEQFKETIYEQEEFYEETDELLEDEEAEYLHDFKESKKMADSYASKRDETHHEHHHHEEKKYHERGYRSPEEDYWQPFIPFGQSIEALANGGRGLLNHSRIIQQPNSQGHGLSPERTADSIDRIVTHHTVSGNMPNLNQVNSWWSGGGRNWNRAGYHFLIRNNGSIWQLVPLLSRSWGAGPTANPRSIHIAIAGNFSENNLPSQAAKDSYGWLVRELLDSPNLPNLNHINHVTRHSDWMATNCSGFTTNQFRAWIPTSNAGTRVDFDWALPDLALNLSGQTTGQVNFRNGPNTNHSVIRSLSINTQLTVLQESNGWSQVRIGNETGWIISTAIQLVERAGQTTGSVNFRTGPGTGHSTIRTLSGNTDLTVLGTLNDWSHVRIGNQQGWIVTSAIRLTPRSGQTSGGVNFRSGSGTNHGVIRFLGPNTQLTVLSERDGWSQVQIGNQTGWIISTAIRFAERPGQTTGSVNFRNGPATNHSIIRFLSGGTQLTIIDERDGWSQVRIGNQTGWIISTAIR